MRFVDTRGTAIFCALLSACVRPLSYPPPPDSPPTSSRVEVGATRSSSPSHVLPDVSYTTITEVLKRPGLFDGRQVRLKGRVVDLQHPTFHLADSAGNLVKVVVTESSKVREGVEVIVTGRLTVPRSATSFSPPQVQDARVVAVSSGGQMPAQPAMPSQPKRGAPSSLAVPPPPGQKEDGRVF